jgi:hypothetical protein
MSKVDNMNNWVSVEYTGGSITLKTRDSSSEMQLVGSSCIANCCLFQKTQSIVFSLDATKSNGLVALAVCLGSRKYVHGLIKIRRTEQGKILVVFSHKAEQSETVPDGWFVVNDLGFTATLSNVDYRLLSVFWDDSAETRGIDTVEKYIGSFERASCKVITDGDVFCNFASGEATKDDLEGAVLQYKIKKDPDLLKRVSKEFILLEKQVDSLRQDLSEQKNGHVKELGDSQKKIVELEAKLEKAISSLIYIKGILLRSWAPWWKKLTYIGTVFDPKHRRFLGTYLK